VTADEGTIEVPGGRIWYRSVGEGGTPQPQGFMDLVNTFLDQRDEAG
jgi:hypothetical protein